MKEVNFVMWGNDDFYFIPTISLHSKYKTVSLFFLKCVIEICY